MPEFNPELFALTPEFPEEDQEEQRAYQALAAAIRVRGVQEFTLLQGADTLSRSKMRPSVMAQMIRNGSIEQIG